MLRGKGGRSGSKTSTTQPDNELTMEQLDQVAGGVATTPPLKDEHVLTPMMGPPLIAPTVVAVSVSPSTHDAPVQQNAPLHIDLTEMTASTAATQLNSGAIDAAHAIGHVEAYAASHHQADVTGLTDLLGSTNGNKDVAASLSAELHNGSAESNLASQVKSGSLSPEDAVKELQRAVDTLTKFTPDGDKPVTDGLFEMSVAHLYNAARDQGNADLQSYLGTIHGFDVRSGLVQIESDHAAADLASGRISINDAIQHTIDVASQQGLPKDVALTALLVDTHGNTTVAQQLSAYVNDNTGFSAGALSNDIATAMQKNNMDAEHAIESIREAVDALARYAPSQLVGTVDMNFAEAVATLKYGTAAQNADLQQYLTQNHSYDLALGDVCLAVEQGYKTNPAGAVQLGIDHCWQQGFPPAIAMCAALAHRAGTADATKLVSDLSGHLNAGSWGNACNFAKDLTIFIQNTQQSENNSSTKAYPSHIDVDKAVALIHMAVDTLAKYAPTKVEGNANLNACEIIYQMQWGYMGASTIVPLLMKDHAYEMNLGEVANAAQYGVTYASAYASYAAYHPEGVYTGEYNAKYWSDKNGTPQVYGLIATMGDVGPAGAAVVAQQIADGLANGTFERDAANLVKAGKITAAQAVESITEALDVCTRFGKQPLGMPADVARTYVLDTLRDEAGTTGAKALTDHVNANFANDLKLGDQVDAYLNKNPQTKPTDAGFLALTGQLHDGMTQAQIQADLTSGHSTIQDVMKSKSPPMSASDAESLLFTMANNGSVPKQVVFAQLESLMTSEKLSPTQVITDIRNAITGNSISADAGVLLLAGLSDRSAQSQQAASAAIDGLVTSGRVSVGVVLADIYNGVASHALSDAEGMAALAMLNASTNAQLRDGGSSLITSLVQAGHVDVTTAIASIHNTSTAGLLTQGAAASILLTLGQNGDAHAQLAIGAELSKLMSPADAAARIHENVLSHRVSADTALSILSGMAQGGGAAQTAANAEVVQLVTSGQTTADHAMIALTTLTMNNTGTQSAINGEIAALVAAKLTTADHAIEVLAGLGAGASEAKQTAIEEEISALVAAKLLTADQACNKLCAMANGGSPTMQAFSGEVIASLVAHKLIDPSQAMQDVSAALIPQSRPWGTPAYWTVTTSIMAEGNADLRNTAAYQASSLMRSFGDNATNLMISTIESATAADAMTGGQAATALGCIASQFATNDPSRDYTSGRFLGAIGQELGNLVAHHEVTASQAMLQVIHAQPYLSMPTMSALVGNNGNLQSGLGAALAIYASEPGHSAFNVASAISQSGSGSVALWAGVAAYATGDLQKTAEETLSLVMFGGWSQQSGSQFPRHYDPVDQQSAMAVFTSIGMSDDARLKNIALREIGQMANYYGPDSAMPYLIKSAGHSSEGQAFIGAGMAAMVAAGADPRVVVAYVSGDGSSISGRYLTGLPAAEALNILNIAGDTGTGRLRAAIADAILDQNLVPPAQMQNYLSQHLSDGLAEAILVERVSRGEIHPTQAIATLNGVIDTFMKSHPAADRSTLQSVALAQLDIATHVGAAEAKSKDVGNSPFYQSFNSEAARLGELQNLINTTDNLKQILTGLGALQFAQTSTGGSSEISGMAHQAMVDYAQKAAGGDKSKADGVAQDAAGFFNFGIDLLASGKYPNKTAFILKNEVMTHPENYQSWINLGSAMAGGPVTGMYLNDFFVRPEGESVSTTFSLIKLSSGLLASAFEKDAVINALGKDGAMAVSGPARMVNVSCSALTDMVTGIINVETTTMVNTGIGLYNTFKDIHEGKNATESAKTMGNNLLLSFSGIHAYDVKDTSVAFGNTFGDLFKGDTSGAGRNASDFGTGLGNMLYTNNAIIQAAQASLVSSANTVAGVAVDYGNSVASAATTAWNETSHWVSGAANTVANAFKSY